MWEIHSKSAFFKAQFETIMEARLQYNKLKGIYPDLEIVMVLCGRPSNGE